MLLIGLSVAARRTELAGLDLGDVELSPDGLEVTVYRAKTMAIHLVGIPCGQHTPTCPVRAWTTRATDHGHTDPHSPASPRITRQGHIAGTITGRGTPDGRMTGSGIANIIKRRGLAAGLDPTQIAGHSLRRGMATAAHRAGADHLAIARQGGWTDGSRQVYRYIQDAGMFNDNPLRGIGL